ncbi:unnamed protein product, partial [Mesorhabditis spiculigera]
MVILSKAEAQICAEETLWEPQMEKDACGVGFVVSIKGEKTYKIMADARIMLERMAHRGACGCDMDTGDGAGVLAAIPDALYRDELKKTDDVDPPPVGEYATGILFMAEGSYKQAKEALGDLARACKLKSSSPRDYAHEDKDQFERNLFLLRKRSNTVMPKQSLDCYICSLSTTIIVYKVSYIRCGNILFRGNSLLQQPYKYYDDLTDTRFISHIALIHSRFSTNTFPAWHQWLPIIGEINTLRGNINLMHAREGVMKSKTYGENLEKLFPVVEDGLTDSGCFDTLRVSG